MAFIQCFQTTLQGAEAKPYDAVICAAHLPCFSKRRERTKCLCRPPVGLACQSVCERAVFEVRVDRDCVIFPFHPNFWRFLQTAAMACNMSKRQDGVAIVTLSSPPVNALGAAGLVLCCCCMMTTCRKLKECAVTMCVTLWRHVAPFEEAGSRKLMR